MVVCAFHVVFCSLQKYSVICKQYCVYAFVGGCQYYSGVDFYFPLSYGIIDIYLLNRVGDRLHRWIYLCWLLLILCCPFRCLLLFLSFNVSSPLFGFCNILLFPNFSIIYCYLSMNPICLCFLRFSIICRTFVIRILLCGSHSVLLLVAYQKYFFGNF